MFQVPFLCVLISTCYIRLFDNSHLNGMRQHFPVASICFSLMVSDAQQLFVNLLAMAWLLPRHSRSGLLLFTFLLVSLSPFIPWMLDLHRACGLQGLLSLEGHLFTLSLPLSCRSYLVCRNPSDLCLLSSCNFLKLCRLFFPWGKVWEYR